MRAKFLIALMLAAAPAPAFAWGPAGHRWISSLAVENLPAEVPAFLRTKAAAETIGEAGNEPDRWRSSGRTHDSERDAGHFIDLTDDNKAMGVVPITALPETRAEYDALLNAGGSDQYKAGYLPYEIVDGFQQLAKDFAYWRATSVGEKRGATAADRAWFAADRKRREALLLRDLGVWSHYVGDVTQPQHNSVHYDQWGDFPNPQGFAAPRGFHVRWENQFVQFNVKRAAVAAGMAPFKDCNCPVMQRVQASIIAGAVLVPPLFALEARSAFPDKAGDPANPVLPEQIAFATKQLSLAASEIRDLTVLAYRAGATGVVGYPGINVADIESGKVILTRQMLGAE